MPSFRSRPFHDFRVLCGLLLGGCAAAPLEPEHVETLAADLERELAARAAAAGAARRSSDPADLWDALVDVSAPAVIAARHELAAAGARARSLGAPPAMLDVEHAGDGSSRETQIMLAFDLPALVGAGRAAAARARAEVDATRAQARLFAARFGTRHELFRALSSLAVARDLASELDELERAVEPNARRLELLDGRGWLPPEQVATARTMLHHLSGMRRSQEGVIAAARARVADVSGLAPDSPWLDDGESTALEAVRARVSAHAEERRDPGTSELLETHPALRLARFDYVAAEADVRVATAERWPALLVGPNVMLVPDDLLLGGVLRLELPWPPAASAAVDAARARRAAARDALVSVLAQAQNAIARRRVELEAAALALEEHAESAAESSERALRAAQARFAIEPAALPEWGMAIDQRARALAARAEALERWLVAAFDLSEALGAAPAPDEGDAR